MKILFWGLTIWFAAQVPLGILASQVLRRRGAHFLENPQCSEPRITVLKEAT